MITNPSLAMMELLQEAVFLVDRLGKVQAVSRGMEQYLGYESGELDREVAAGLIDTLSEAWQQYVQKCRENRGTKTTAISFQAKNGESLSCQVEGTSLSSEADDPALLIFLRVVPNALGRAQTAIVDSRIKILEDRLHQKDEFIAQLAHGLRNPLGPVLNGLKVLHMAGVGPETQEKAHSLIERQIHYLTRIINEVLEVSRLTRGKIHLHSEPLDLAALIRGVVDSQRGLPEWTGITLMLDVPEKPVWIQGDSPRMVQIIKELLDNAVKFTAVGGRVSIRLKVNPQDKQVVVSVRDNGIGIESDHLRTLFDIFTPSNPGRHGSKRGLGIGLMLVKGLVELHGGEIRAASEGTGRGSEFSLFMPLLENPSVSTPSSVKALPSHVNPPRILIIEDNRDSADSMCMLLQFLGYEVRVAYTGPEGVKLAQEWEPLVVLSDIGLPGLDGWGVARELRQHPLTAQTRLIAITAYGLEADQNMSHDAGFEAHLVKPVDINELRKLLSSPGKEPL